MVYRTLLGQAQKDPLLPKLKIAYRGTWRENQLLFHEVSKLLRVLEAERIETIVLKGAALSLLYYKDLGLRPMHDFDVMVRMSQRSAAIAVMKDAGWSFMPRTPERINDAYFSIVHAHGFTDPNGRECDLHWHLIPECCRADSDDDFWDEAVPLEIHGVKTRSLSPTDHLLHACIHGAVWNPIPPIRWIADAMMIMKRSAIDWHRIVAQARKRRLTVPLAATLGFLATEYRAPVPRPVIESLRKTAVTKVEVAEYNYKNRNYQDAPFGFLPVLWFRYLRHEPDQSPTLKVIGFLRYLERFWGIDKTRQLPTYAALMIARRVRIIILPHLGRLARALTPRRFSAAG